MLKCQCVMPGILSAVNESVEDVKERVVWESDVHSFDDNTAI